MLGKNLRSLKGALGCSYNEAIGILVQLWVWGLRNANDDGLIPSATKEDLVDAFIYDPSGQQNPQNFIDAAIESGWIDEFGGQLYIANWDIISAEYARTLKRRESDRKRQQAKRSKSIVDEPKAVDSKERPAKKTNAKSNTYSDDFELFWSVYPRKNDKGAAYKKYLARLKEWKPEQLLEAARRYASECALRHTDQKYIKHAKTFLSDTLPFRDYLDGCVDVANTSGLDAVSSDTFDDENPFAAWEGEINERK